mmetsp:Transcript_13524/g.35758  ORF Transcript_13524/g.35758 Transcript_13524/m.35758 type:complete len:658 (-) Transcript_13524:22-1995(-)
MALSPGPPVGALLPEPLAGAEVLQELTIKDVPTPEELAATLKKWGCDTADWGKGNTKAVDKYWAEIQGEEAGLEIWKTPEGRTLPVRVTHVLRAKVTAPDAYRRGIFLFNTWQQYGDGRQRTRNGLLSEKLTTAEMPLRDHLHEVCQRAVTEEEMQRVVESAFKIGPTSPAPAFDRDYKCPLEVIDEHFVDHTIEVEASKSYPGLTTVYHLYTVDIICSGLPLVDFNTLEFDHPDSSGKRKLKYVHAWVWLQWAKIQRYLFEGSTMKERKTRGSFKSAKDMEAWLRQFDLDLGAWGTGKWKRVADLYAEIENEQTQLEHWGRQDGVPLLMRVVHVIQCKVTSPEVKTQGKFLFQTWHQEEDSRKKLVNRTLATKLSTAELPFDADRFAARAKETVRDKLSYVMDQYVQLDQGRRPSKDELARSSVTFLNALYSDHRYDMESSPSFKELITMYHLYTIEVECAGLPTSDFASLSYARDKTCAMGWRWVTWQQSLDILHQEMQEVERKKGAKAETLSSSAEDIKACLEELDRTGLSEAFRERLAQLSERLKQQETEKANKFELPPPMVAKLEDRSLLDAALLQRQQGVRASGRHLTLLLLKPIRAGEELPENPMLAENGPLATEHPLVEFVESEDPALDGKLCSIFCRPPSLKASPRQT